MYFTLEQLRNIVARYVPEFRIHHDDQYMPCSFKYFMNHSELRMHKSGGSSEEVLIPKGSVTGALLVAKQKEHSDARLWLHLDPAARCGAPKDQLDSVPVYAHVKYILSNDDELEALEITYVTLYAFNGAYTVLGVIQTGDHDGDIEHITVRVNCDGDLVGVWYNAHRSRDGEWTEYSDIERSPVDGRIVAYVALNGHGVYPKPGIVHRHFFLGNDRCSGRGPVWRPNTIVLLPLIDDVTGETKNSGSVLEQHVDLKRCQSRGCNLKSTKVILDSNGITNDSNGGALASESTLSTDAANVIVDDPCDWLAFRGNWGTAPAICCQQWYDNAEPPISRSAFLRIFGHFVGETHRI